MLLHGSHVSPSVLLFVFLGLLSRKAEEVCDPEGSGFNTENSEFLLVEMVWKSRLTVDVGRWAEITADQDFDRPRFSPSAHRRTRRVQCLV
jgi:hypothetical protein